MEKIRTVSSLPKEPVSMDAPFLHDSDARIGDFVADPASVSVLQEISAEQVRNRLGHLLKTLTPREEKVIRLRFGIDRPDCLTLAQVGQQLSVSRERARQIEQKALARLRHLAALEDLASHLAS